MSTRVPPSNKPPQTQPTERARRSTRPQASDDKPKLIKQEAAEEQALSPEAALWAGQDMDRSLEIRASDIEQRMAEIAQSEQAEKEEGAEHGAEQRDKAEKNEKKGLFKVFSWQKPGQQPKTDAKTLLQKQQEAKQEALKKQPAFKPTVPTNLTGISASRLQAVGQVSQLAGKSVGTERPPDAFSLLKEAREKGVLFVEDALAEGHSEDKDDPEHAAAVEECIAQCFGVRGILRIGPGHNDKNEKIIVVATTHGFTDASLQKVPEKVHKFATLIAIPFDLLPLKRERP
ncbi:MAG: hypothetical protein Q8L48_20830 [Archangium sp.]|nr:hypothetical protein [Archangium sp.]